MRESAMRWRVGAFLSGMVAVACFVATSEGRAQKVDATLPSLSNFSIQQMAQPSPLQAKVSVTATVDMKQRQHPEVFTDLTNPSRRLTLACQQLHGSHIWSCSTTVFLTPASYEAQFAIFFDLAGGVVNGNRSFVTLPVPPFHFSVTGKVGRYPIPIICTDPNPARCP